MVVALGLAHPALAGNDRVEACFRLNSNAEQRDCLRDLNRSASAELDRVYSETIDRATTLQAERIDELKVPFYQR